MKLSRKTLRKLILQEIKSLNESYDENIIRKVMAPYEGIIDKIFENSITSSVFEEYSNIRPYLKLEFYPNRMYKPVPAASETEEGVAVEIGFNLSDLVIGNIEREQLEEFFKLLENALNQSRTRSNLLNGGDDPKFLKAEAFKGRGSILIYLKHL